MAATGNLSLILVNAVTAKTMLATVSEALQFWQLFQTVLQLDGFCQQPERCVPRMYYRRLDNSVGQLADDEAWQALKASARRRVPYLSVELCVFELPFDEAATTGEYDRRHFADNVLRLFDPPPPAGSVQAAGADIYNDDSDGVEEILVGKPTHDDDIVVQIERPVQRQTNDDDDDDDIVVEIERRPVRQQTNADDDDDDMLLIMEQSRAEATRQQLGCSSDGEEEEQLAVPAGHPLEHDRTLLQRLGRELGVRLTCVLQSRHRYHGKTGSSAAYWSVVGGDERKVCRFFLRGGCKRGSKCRDAHERPTCPYWQRDGSCRQQERCQLAHALAAGDGLVLRVSGPKPVLLVAVEALRDVVALRSGLLDEYERDRQQIVYVIVDHSNIAIGAKNYTGRHDSSARINVARLVATVEHERQAQFRLVGGSSRSPSDAVWKHWSDAGYTVRAAKLAAGQGEQFVDDMLCGAINRLLIEKRDGSKGTFVILTGDGNVNADHTIAPRGADINNDSFFDAVNRAMFEGFHVELWCWKRSVSKRYRQFADYPNFRLIYLDARASSFIFHQKSSSSSSSSSSST